MGVTLSALVHKAIFTHGHDPAPLLERHAPHIATSRLSAALNGAKGSEGKESPPWVVASFVTPGGMVGNRTAVELATIVTAAVGDEHRGRSLKWDWKKIDFSRFSLTFLRLTLSHRPYDWDKFFGDRRVLGKFGGIGAGAMLRVANSAWLRLGVFEGGWGINLDNNARAFVLLLKKEIDIFRATLEFKVDMTYRVPVPAGVLNLAEDLINLATTAMAKFESLKDMALKYARKFADWLRKLKAKLDGFIARIGGNLTSMLTDVFPRLVKAAAQLLRKIFGIVEDILGIKDGLIQSGLSTFVQALDKAVDTVASVTTNSTFVLGMRSALDTADEVQWPRAH